MDNSQQSQGRTLIGLPQSHAIPGPATESKGMGRYDWPSQGHVPTVQTKGAGSSPEERGEMDWQEKIMAPAASQRELLLKALLQLLAQLQPRVCPRVVPPRFGWLWLLGSLPELVLCVGPTLAPGSSLRPTGWAPHSQSDSSLRRWPEGLLPAPPGSFQASAGPSALCCLAQATVSGEDLISGLPASASAPWRTCHLGR